MSPEDEAHQVVRVGMIRVSRDGPLERGQRLVVEPPIVQDLADIEVDDRAVGIERERTLEPLLCLLEIARRLLGQAQLDHRAEIIGVMSEQLLEFGDRLGEPAE